MPTNKENYDRELRGPAAYDKFNQVSKICQAQYLNLIKVQTVILMAMAFLSSFPVEPGEREQLFRYSLVVLSTIILGIIIFLQNKNYMQGWQNARFIAESVLSNSWLYAFKIGPYSNEGGASQNFYTKVDQIEKEVDLKSFNSIYFSPLPAIADWMEELFKNPDVESKKIFYIRYRIDDQINWYTTKSQLNRKQSGFWFVLSLVFLLGGTILALIIPLNKFSTLGFLSTITAAILTWRQTKRFDELKITYAVAAKELSSLKEKLREEKTEAGILKFAEEAETLISREHKLWFNWTYIS